MITLEGSPNIYVLTMKGALLPHYSSFYLKSKDYRAKRTEIDLQSE